MKSLFTLNNLKRYGLTTAIVLALLSVVLLNRKGNSLPFSFKTAPYLKEAHNGSHIEKYYYNTKGNVSYIEETHLGSVGSTLMMLFDYDEKDLVKEARLSINGKMQYFQKFYYDENERMFRIKVLSSDKMKVLFNYWFEYNDEGQIKRRTNTMTKEKEEYEYDDDGNLKKLYFTDLTGSMNYYMAYTYDSDIQYFGQPGLPVYVSLHEGSYRPHLLLAPKTVKMQLQNPDGVYETATSISYENKANSKGALVERKVSNGVNQQTYMQKYVY
jgi:hypothetical protein